MIPIEFHIRSCCRRNSAQIEGRAEVQISLKHRNLEQRSASLFRSCLYRGRALRWEYQVNFVPSQRLAWNRRKKIRNSQRRSQECLLPAHMTTDLFYNFVCSMCSLIDQIVDKQSRNRHRECQSAHDEQL